MKKQMKAAALASAIAIVSTPVLASSDEAQFEALEHQIEALQTRIAALEAYRTFTSFMPNFSERFHVMHRAGEAGDWAVAAHEFEEMKRLTILSTTIDAERGQLMQAMLGPSFEALESAIEHNDHEKFETALTQTIDTCNACHAATGSDFVQVTLDAREALSIRHPHKFMEQKVPGGHTHGMPSGMGGMMSGTGTMMPAKPASDEHHDDTGKPAHND
jgi:hypothetical protein